MFKKYLESQQTRLLTHFLKDRPNRYIGEQMIYKNEYGKVDLLSKQVQSLKSDKGVIGAKLSGGSDTALLLYLLAKEIQERNLNFSIIHF